MAPPDTIRGVVGLDVYVGSFTRYYMHDWETIIQQAGRAQGLPVQIIRTNAEPDDAIEDPEQLRKIAVAWRQLCELNDRTFRGSSDEVDGWGTDMPDGSDPRFEPRAKVGLSIMLRLTAAAVNNRLPMLLDY